MKAATKAIEQKMQLDTILYTDFSKALEKLDHSILNYKFRNVRFSRRLVNFFQSY